MKKLIVVCLSSVLLIALLVSGCGNGDSSSTAPPTSSQTSSQPSVNTTAANSSNPASTTAQQAPGASTRSGGVMRIIVPENPRGSLGVPANGQGQFFLYSRPIIEPLLTYNSSGELVGVLATDWTIAEDLTYIDFTLRKGVKFHDGSDFNAEAAAWNLNFNIQKSATGTTNLDSVSIVDENTIRVKLKKFVNTVFMDIAGGPGKMISPSNFQKYGEEASNWTNIVGTGPFQFVNYETDKSFEFKRFDQYWGGKPLLDGIKFLIIPDFVTAELSFEAGDGDVIYYVGRWGEVARDMVPKGFVAQGMNMGVRGIFADSGNSGSILSSLKVREAVEYAIDREKITKALGNDYAFALYQMSPPHTNGYIPDYSGRQYNPDKARQLLTEAGYPDGFETTIYAGVPVSGNEIPAIQAYLKAVNINVNIESTSVAKWLDQEANGWSNGYYTAGMQCLSTEANFGTFLSRYFVDGSGRYPNIKKSDELKQTIAAGLVEPSTMGQKTLYQKANQLMMQDALFLPLWYDQLVWVMTKEVHDLPASAWEKPEEFSFAQTWLGQ